MSANSGVEGANVCESLIDSHIIFNNKMTLFLPNDKENSSSLIRN